MSAPFAGIDAPPTRAELDALGDGAIVLTTGGTCFIKIGHDGLVYGGEWRSPYKVPKSQPVRGEFVDSAHVALCAARVLYEGERRTRPTSPERSSS